MASNTNDKRSTPKSDEIKTQDLIEQMTKMTSAYAKMEHAQKMEMTQRNMENMKLMGLESKRTTFMEEWLKNNRRIEEETRREEQKVINSAVMKRMIGVAEPIRTDDGDQSPVFGDDAMFKLKVKWANARDWGPHNQLFHSRWLRVLATGDYDQMEEIIDHTPRGEVKQLLERRESLLNFSAVFHVVKGAMMLDKSGQHFDPAESFHDPSKKPRHIECFVKLIQLGANIEARDFAGFTSLFYCVTMYGNPTTVKMAKILLNNGANVNAKNRLGETALAQPVSNKLLECVELLLDYGADPTMQDNNGCSLESMYPYDKDIKPLFAKARKNRCKAMRISAKADADGSLRCELCAEISKSRCTGCYVTRYCSKECQKADWKQHKKKCVEIQSKFVNVNLNQLEGSLNISWTKKGKVERKGCYIETTKDNFVLKVQIPFDDTAAKIWNDEEEYKVLLVYNENKSIYGTIEEIEPSYGLLVEKIRNEGVFGDKGFFFAILDKDKNIRINIDNILPPRTW